MPQNFDNAELKQAADLCHLHNIKIYLTVNTIIFDNQVNEFSRIYKKMPQMQELTLLLYRILVRRKLSEILCLTQISTVLRK